MSNSVMVLILVVGRALLCLWLGISVNGFVVPSVGISRTSYIRHSIDGLAPCSSSNRAPRLSACRVNQKKEKAARNMIYMRKYRKPGKPHRRRQDSA